MSWPVMPGVPAAGHVTRAGYWHPGAADVCQRCYTMDNGRRICRLSGAIAYYDNNGSRQKAEPNTRYICRECAMPLIADARGRIPRHYQRRQSGR